MVKCYICKKEIKGKKYIKNRFDYAKNKYVNVCKECFEIPLVILKEKKEKKNERRK